MYLQVVSLKQQTSVVHIYQSVYKGMLLPNSISPSLCTVCICTQHICVFVCPLIPNLNICPTSPHNIGPLARPCPLETAINSVLFLPILVHRPMTRKQDQKWAESSVKILLGNSFAIPHKGAGSFHIHRKTMKELGILAVLGVREQPNLAQNLVTHRH